MAVAGPAPALTLRVCLCLLISGRVGATRWFLPCGCPVRPPAPQTGPFLPPRETADCVLTPLVRRVLQGNPGRAARKGERTRIALTVASLLSA